MDKLILHGAKFRCQVGCYVEERAIPQEILLDIELFFDIHPAAVSGNLTDTIDFGEVHDEVKKLVENREYILVETMAEDVAALLLNKFPTTKVWLRLKKSGPMQKRGAEWAGVEIVRQKADPRPPTGAAPLAETK